MKAQHWRAGLLAAVMIVAIGVPAGSRADSPAPHGAAPPRPAAPAVPGEHVDAAHGPADESAAQKLFRGDIGNIIITLVIFFVLLGVLGKTAWKPLLGVLEQRERTIRDSLEQAQRERHEAQELLKQYTVRIDRARLEASAIVDEGKRDAEAVRRRIQDEARREADEMIARARREIQLATDAAVKSVYDQAADLAVQVAGRIIHKELRPDDHRALVNESLERMKSSAN